MAESGFYAYCRNCGRRLESAREHTLNYYKREHAKRAHNQARGSFTPNRC